jgi:hypothetical protein
VCVCVCVCVCVSVCVCVCVCVVWMGWPVVRAHDAERAGGGMAHRQFTALIVENTFTSLVCGRAELLCRIHIHMH